MTGSSSTCAGRSAAGTISGSEAVPGQSKDSGSLSAVRMTIRAEDGRAADVSAGSGHIDGDQVTIKDPEGYLDTSVPTPVIDDLGRGDRRRVRFEEDQKLWAWNMPYLLRGPYLLATRA